MRSFSYLNSAKSIIEAYDGGMPLSHWLRKYFRDHKKFGSQDRKAVSHLVYCFYRLGAAFSSSDINERLLTGIFLCSETPQKVLEEQRPEWNEMIGQSLSQKLSLFPSNEPENIFPLSGYLSSAIDFGAFIRSMLLQPHLFLRSRPGAEEILIKKLSDAGVEFERMEEGGVALPNQTRVEEIIELNREAVVQDKNSQQVLQPLKGIEAFSKSFSAWDCCAASGGKSILLLDRFPAVALTVTDIRDSILANLKKRFSEAGIRNYTAFTANAAAQSLDMKKKFDLIICDAPCSGSGTWARTPERLRFFREEEIIRYASLQKSIAANASRFLRQGGYFLYITCSVFKMENEDLVQSMVSDKLKVQSQQYYIGYEERADTLFVALLRAL